MIVVEKTGKIPDGKKESEESNKNTKNLIDFPEIDKREFNDLIEESNGGYGSELPHKTQSICPETRKIVTAVVWERNNKLWISKECSKDIVTALYYEDVDMYNQFKKMRYDWNLKSTNVENTGINCPLDCGLCSRHKSHTSLLNIALTNRCNLNCWYCFFYAKEHQPIYEPSLEQIRMMLRNGKGEKDIGADAIQLTGGEPTMREDLTDVIRTCKEEGYSHIQLNTDGIKLAFDPELAQNVKNAGANTLYLSYDGMTPTTNWKNHWEIPYILQNVRKARGPGIVLVPTIMKNGNEDELGDIVNFAFNHMDVVRSVNMQPISLVGRTPKKQRRKLRMTIPGAIKRIEEQTNGAIAMENWHTIPIAGYIARFFEVFTGRKYYMTSHFACGAATYVFLDNKKIIPISKFIDVEGFVEFLSGKTEELKDKKRLKKISKTKVGAEILLNFKRFYDEEYAPEDLNVLNLIKNAFLKGSYRALGEFHTKTLFLGMMHFMDEYNYDIERVERCVIHYAMPDGRIVPFCAFNVLPELYRDKVQKQFSYSAKEWREKNPEWEYKKDKYRRTKEFIEKTRKSKLYKDTYENIERYF
ncbi:MAG: radical SAM protein [Euryarchaeota archaeon]|nr:radical SAM protein [Euryarchaeota archaeon]